MLIVIVPIVNGKKFRVLFDVDLFRAEHRLVDRIDEVRGDVVSRTFVVVVVVDVVIAKINLIWKLDVGRSAVD